MHPGCPQRLRAAFSSHRHRSYLRMPVQPLSPAVFPRLSGKFRIPLRAAASEALFRSYQETAP